MVTRSLCEVEANEVGLGLAAPPVQHPQRPPRQLRHAVAQPDRRALGPAAQAPQPAVGAEVAGEAGRLRQAGSGSLALPARLSAAGAITSSSAFCSWVMVPARTKLNRARLIFPEEISMSAVSGIVAAKAASSRYRCRRQSH